MDCDATHLPTLLNATVAAFSVLGGVMAAVSGFLAADLYRATGRPDGLGEQINRGIALGFSGGLPLATLALMIVLR